MATFNFKKLLALPQSYAGNTLYVIKGADPNTAKIYVSDNTGSSISEVDTSSNALKGVVISSPTAPNLATTKAPMWWDSDRAILFVRYNDGTGEQWVQASPNLAIPEFAGTGGLYGIATTMARSDHQHDHLVIEADW